MQLLGVNDEFRAEDGKLFHVAEQEFDASYLEGLKWAREQDAQRRCPELWRVASIPAIFVHKWLKEGFNIYEAPLHEIVRKLHREELSEFLTTDKRVI